MSVVRPSTPLVAGLNGRGMRITRWVAIGALVLFLAGAPSIVDSFTLAQILTKALWLGIAARKRRNIGIGTTALNERTFASLANPRRAELRYSGVAFLNDEVSWLPVSRFDRGK